MLLSQGYFALFLIIALGILIGHIKIGGISLDSSAVIFVALVLGYMGITVPQDFSKIGVLLFIFTIGIQAGPGFFDSFHKQGIRTIMMVVIMIVSAAVVAVGLAFVFKIDFKLAVGLLAGALTSTPGLAAAIESTGSPIASIGYGVAYPFGVLGVILFVRLLPRIMKIDIHQAVLDHNRLAFSMYPRIINANFVVENKNVFGRSLRELQVKTMTGAVISRVMHDEEAITPVPETVLYAGDIIKAVGSEDDLKRIEILIGCRTEQEMPLSKGHDVQWILVTNKKTVGKSIGELGLLKNYNANVTRIRRSGIDISPSPANTLRFGDKLMVASDKGNMENVINLLGNNVSKLSETDFLPIAVGIVFGILFGSLKIPLPGGTFFSPGLTGGVLAVAIVLSKIGRTGPIVWSMSGSANQLLRTLGLLFFLAAVGTDAGAHITESYMQYGASLFLVGGVLTLLPMFVGTLVGRLLFKINFLTLLGALTGGMTSTPGLAAIDPITDCDAPQIAYATVYPVALVVVIICAQIMGRL